jgi:hypothetical protein
MLMMISSSPQQLLFVLCTVLLGSLFFHREYKFFRLGAVANWSNRSSNRHQIVHQIVIRMHQMWRKKQRQMWQRTASNLARRAATTAITETHARGM